MPEGPPRGVPADAAGPDFVERCRGATARLDTGHPALRAFVDAAVGSAEAPRERAVRRFYAVRDRVRYDPFSCSRERTDDRASSVAASPRSWCVPKSGAGTTAVRERDGDDRPACRQRSSEV